MPEDLQSITFLVPALNEERKIEDTVKTIIRAINHFRCDYEILLVNDGSTDATPQIMDRLARENQRIRVLHNKKNLGLGGAYKRGIQHVRKDYIMWVSGDNAETAEHIINIISHVGQADIVIPVLKAGPTRPLLRRITSRLFTIIVNFLFGLKINYYNGAVVHRADLLKKITIRTNSFAYQAEALVKLSRLGCSYVEVPYSSATYDGLFSYAMRPKNLLAVLKTLVSLFLEVRGARLCSQLNETKI